MKSWNHDLNHWFWNLVRFEKWRTPRWCPQEVCLCAVYCGWRTVVTTSGEWVMSERFFLAASLLRHLSIVACRVRSDTCNKSLIVSPSLKPLTIRYLIATVPFCMQMSKQNLHVLAAQSLKATYHWRSHRTIIRLLFTAAKKTLLYRFIGGNPTLVRFSKIFHIWSYVRSTVSRIPNASSCMSLRLAPWCY